MNKKLFSVLFLVLFLFSSSCQKKQVTQSTPSSTPFPEKPIEKQVELNPKNIEINDETSKNIEWINIEPEEYSASYPANKSDHVADPYLDRWELEKNHFASSRFYRDFNGDGKPELCLRYDIGTGVDSFVLYKINKTDYSFISYLAFKELQLLPTKHSGYFDLLCFTRSTTLGNGDIEGNLSLWEFNGSRYIRKKYAVVVLREAYLSKLFTPDDDINEEVNNSQGQQGSIQDDDKYRRMIK